MEKNYIYTHHPYNDIEKQKDAFAASGTGYNDVEKIAVVSGGTGYNDIEKIANGSISGGGSGDNPVVLLSERNYIENIDGSFIEYDVTSEQLDEYIRQNKLILIYPYEWEHTSDNIYQTNRYELDSITYLNRRGNVASGSDPADGYKALVDMTVYRGRNSAVYISTNEHPYLHDIGMYSGEVVKTDGGLL